MINELLRKLSIHCGPPRKYMTKDLEIFITLTFFIKHFTLIYEPCSRCLAEQTNKPHEYVPIIFFTCSISGFELIKKLIPASFAKKLLRHESY